MQSFKYPNKYSSIILKELFLRKLGCVKWLLEFINSNNLQIDVNNLEILYSKENINQYFECLNDNWQVIFKLKINESMNHKLYKEWFKEFLKCPIYHKELTSADACLIMKVRSEMLYLHDRPFSKDASRDCQMCNSNNRENIIHFLGQCNSYKHLRMKYFKSEFLCEEQCIRLFSEESLNDISWKDKANYIRSALGYRYN